MPQPLSSFPTGGAAVVIGARGGIGGALSAGLSESGRFTTVLGLHRASQPPLDLLDEQSIGHAAQQAAALPGALRLVVVATGMLHEPGLSPERSLKELDGERLARSFALNATGPALVMKHFLPLLARDGKAVLAALSARVGSIADNSLGGWYGYRASKAALNQLVHTAAVEIGRRRPDQICVALHPGTVATALSAPFAKAGLDVRSPAVAAADLLAVIDGLDRRSSGGFYDHKGVAIEW